MALGLLGAGVAYAADGDASLSSLTRNADGAVNGVLTVQPFGNTPAVVDTGSLVLTADGRDFPAKAQSASSVERSAILLIDRSGSMRETGMATVRSSVQQFLQIVPKDIKVGVVSFADTPDVGRRPDAGPRRHPGGGRRPQVVGRHRPLRRPQPGHRHARRGRRPQHHHPQRRQGHHQHAEGAARRAEAQGERRPGPGDRLQDQLHRQPRARVPRRRRAGLSDRRREQRKGVGGRLLLRREGAGQPGVLDRADAGRLRAAGRHAARYRERQALHRDLDGRLR